MEIVNSEKPSHILTKRSILDVWKDSKYAYFFDISTVVVVSNRLNCLLSFLMCSLRLYNSKLQFFLLWWSIRWKQYKYILIFRQIHHIFLFGKRLQTVCKQFVYLIKHYTVQRYSRQNTRNHMQNEEKAKLILIPSQEITLLLHPVISSRRDLASASFKHVCIFLKDLRGLRQISATESPLKVMKKAFYFNLKALFVLGILKFCPDFPGCVEKQLDMVL